MTKTEMTKRRILKKAEQQFIENGISATQMKDIALLLNISRRTLYRYFPSKEELAFEIELIVMEQIQDYMTPIEVDQSRTSGYEKVCKYFHQVTVADIKEQLKFTAAFDRHFQDEYPSQDLKDKLVATFDPEDDPLYQYIVEGIDDGSIRGDLTASELYHFITQNFFALFQRLILREKHLKYEYCDSIDFQKLFEDIILKGISN